MQSAQRFLAILSADLRERTRSPRFWALLGLMIVVTWWCFPSPDDGYMILALEGGQRGSYSSAWVGMVLAMAYSLLLGLGGFYLVRGTLVRDFDTRVWQLLVATPMTRGGFLLAKWLSHMLVLFLIIAIGLAVGLVAQWLRAEDRAIDLPELIKPILLLSLPGLAMTSMAAIWFDLLPWLRRSAGNVLFFLLWITVLASTVSRLEVPNSLARTSWFSDPNGLVLVGRDFHRVREQQTGKPQEFGFSLGAPRREAGPELFAWKSWSVRPMDVFGRSIWLFLAVTGVLLAAPLLDWAAARGSGMAKAGSHAGLRLRWLDRLLGPFARGPFAIIVVAELTLALRERRRWWWLLALLAAGLQAFAPAESVRIGMLLAWLLPLDILARGILREHDNGTGALVLTAPGILPRLLAARFAIAFVLLLALTLPGLLRLLATAPLAALAVLTINASIASWGLALGALWRNSRPFELALLIALYAGLQGAALFDLSTHPQLTALWHAGALLPAWLLLAWAWPRLARC